MFLQELILKERHFLVQQFKSPSLLYIPPSQKGAINNVGKPVRCLACRLMPPVQYVPCKNWCRACLMI
jgi:hypothetical protein